MFASYPALFYYDKSEKVPFFITFPDFTNSATQGTSISDAMAMASDWLGITIADSLENNRNLPKPSDIKSLSLKKDNPYPNDLKYDPALSFVSMVLVDLTGYIDSGQPIKKTLTIPKWADKLGKELKLNFSQTLTDAISNKKLNN
ncbi:type II toxin-antitoxin system HicB family antitoxin [Pediococcus damnosus]|uniref:type II toxin-antitoxin system HicB family antitoxin n=1 Tax=Pediococcus damnosus TaxID=51663 RepID=UPI000705471D|nr:type II toxin-antitoxin system HicB family antitoxin [Pediococcus damnosus]KRN44059.1 toxin-antitoxin system, antitoxin component, HicB family [Pediococcus damnosus]